MTLALALAGCGGTPRPPEPPRPNFLVILADDLGWGDLASYGHPVFETPHFDRLAARGQRWTRFYSAASVCTPSRAALLTGRYAVRTGLAGPQRVLFPWSGGGLPAEQITRCRLSARWPESRVAAHDAALEATEDVLAIRIDP